MTHAMLLHKVFPKDGHLSIFACILMLIILMLIKGVFSPKIGNKLLLYIILCSHLHEINIVNLQAMYRVRAV